MFPRPWKSCQAVQDKIPYKSTFDNLLCKHREEREGSKIHTQVGNPSWGRVLRLSSLEKAPRSLGSSTVSAEKEVWKVLQVVVMWQSRVWVDSSWECHPNELFLL